MKIMLAIRYNILLKEVQASSSLIATKTTPHHHLLGLLYCPNCVVLIELDDVRWTTHLFGCPPEPLKCAFNRIHDLPVFSNPISILLSEINPPLCHVEGEKGFPGSTTTWNIEVLLKILSNCSN